MWAYLKPGLQFQPSADQRDKVKSFKSKGRDWWVGNQVRVTTQIFVCGQFPNTFDRDEQTI
jgi:hypothetical protein